MKKLKVKTGYKQLQCKYCNRIVERVDNNAIKVTCSICTTDLVNGKLLDLRK
jgi:phage FluMu protein Com